MSIHDGHRERLKERFRKEGLDNFDEINVLELALFYCIARKDTNPLAHALLDHFGSLTQVIEAPIEEIMKVPGVGENTATFIALLRDVSRYYQSKKSDEAKPLTTIDDCAKYLLPHFLGRRDETVFLLCLDAKCNVLCCRKVGEGSVNSASVPIRRIVEMALAVNATSVILAHNHPSGIAQPSGEDIATTGRLFIALDAVGVELTDHIVVAGEHYKSVRQSCVIRAEDLVFGGWPN